MAVFYRKQNNLSNDEGNIFWTTMSDLMLGLAIIFITLFVLAMTGFTQQAMQQKKLKADVSKEIEKALKQNKIDATIDKETGDLKIPSVELFDVNSYVLKPRGKALLDKIAPVYINTLFANKELSDQIEYIRIQGHTDSQIFAGVKSVNQQFLRNMDLSLKRANAVAEYLFLTKYDKQYEEPFRKRIVVEGRSSNDPILVNGTEDYAKSRRVELKIKVKDWNVSEIIGSQIENDRRKQHNRNH